MYDSRNKFIATSIELMLTHDVDGLDIDWRYPFNEHIYHDLIRGKNTWLN